MKKAARILPATGRRGSTLTAFLSPRTKNSPGTLKRTSFLSSIIRGSPAQAVYRAAVALIPAAIATVPSSGSSFRYNSAEYLYEHLKYLKDRFHIRHVNFYDDQFTFNRKRVTDFTRAMIDRPLGMTFNCAVRAEHIDSDLAGMMKRQGAG